MSKHAAVINTSCVCRCVILSLSNVAQAGALVNAVASTVKNISYILDAELKYINVIKEQKNEDSKSIQKI